MKKNNSVSDKAICGVNCGCIIVILIINLFAGAISVNYILSWFDKYIPLWADAIIGLFVAEISVPVAIVGWILKICGVF
jgi:hypothetical protein